MNNQIRQLSRYKSQFAKTHQFDLTVFEPLPEISLHISKNLTSSLKTKFIGLAVEIYKESHKCKLDDLSGVKAETRTSRVLVLKPLLLQYMNYISGLSKILPKQLSIFECRIIASISLATSSYAFYKDFMVELADHLSSRSTVSYINNEHKVLDLLNSDIDKYKQSCKSLSNYHPALGKILEGKNIAIVGPVYPQKKQGKEIDSFDIVIRFNFTKKSHNPIYFGYKTNCSFYLSGALEQACNNDILSNLDFFIYQKTKSIKNIKLPKHKGFERFQPAIGCQPLIAGGANALQRALIMLLMYKPKTIKAFNMNMWLNNVFEESYAAKHSHRDTICYLTDFIWHDPAGNFLFTQNLLNKKLFEADNELKKILALSLPDYLDQLGKSIGTL